MAYATRYMNEQYRGLSYGTAASLAAAPGAYSALFAEAIEVAVKQNPLQPMTQRSQAARGKDAAIMGADQGELSCKLQLRGGKTAAAARGTSPIVTLAQYMGFSLSQLAGGADKVTGGSASTLECADGDDPGWAIGDFVLVNADEDGTPDLQMRCISRIQSSEGTTTITVFPDFSTNPANGDTFYAVDVLKPSPGKMTTYHGLKAYRGAGATDRHMLELLGCAGSMLIEEIAAGEIPYVTMKWLVDNFAASEDNRVEAQDDFAKASPLLSDSFYLDSQDIPLASFSFNPGLEPKPIVGSSGAQGRINWHHSDPDPELVIKTLHDNQHWTDLAAETERTAFISSVLDNMQAWAIGVPAVQIIEAGYGDYPEEMTGAALKLKINNPGQNTDDTDYPLFSMGFSGAAT